MAIFSNTCALCAMPPLSLGSAALLGYGVWMWESRATRASTIYMLVIVGHIIWARRYRVWGLFIMSIVHSPYSIHNNKQQTSNQTHIHCDASQLGFFLLIQEHTCQQRVGRWSSWNCLLCGAGNFLASCHHLKYRSHGGKTSGLNGYQKEPQAWSLSFGFLPCCHGEIAVAMFIHQQFDFRRSQFAMGFNVHLNFFRELCISRHLFWNGYLCIDPRCDFESRLFLLLQLSPCIVPERGS